MWGRMGVGKTLLKMKTLEERTPEGLLELFLQAQISLWAETTVGWYEGEAKDKKTKELKEKANEIRQEILKRTKHCECTL